MFQTRDGHRYKGPVSMRLVLKVARQKNNQEKYKKRQALHQVRALLELRAERTGQ